MKLSNGSVPRATGHTATTALGSQVSAMVVGNRANDKKCAINMQIKEICMAAYGRPLACRGPCVWKALGQLIKIYKPKQQQIGTNKRCCEHAELAVLRCVVGTVCVCVCACECSKCTNHIGCIHQLCARRKLQIAKEVATQDESRLNLKRECMQQNVDRAVKKKIGIAKYQQLPDLGFKLT